MNKNIKDERHRNIHIDDSPVRFEYRHPMIFEDGTLISHSDYAPLFKIDFCSNLLWINEETKFHHSLELDSENNIYVGGQLKPFSKYISESEWVWDNWMDDAIIKVNKDGKIIYTKSIAEIMIENELIDNNYLLKIIENIDVQNKHILNQKFFKNKNKGKFKLSYDTNLHKNAKIIYQDISI